MGSSRHRYADGRRQTADGRLPFRWDAWWSLEIAYDGKYTDPYALRKLVINFMSIHVLLMVESNRASMIQIIERMIA